MLTSYKGFSGHLIQAAFVVGKLIDNLALEILEFGDLSGQCIKFHIQGCLHFQSIPDIKVQVITVRFIGGFYTGYCSYEMQ